MCMCISLFVTICATVSLFECRAPPPSRKFCCKTLYSGRRQRDGGEKTKKKGEGEDSEIHMGEGQGAYLGAADRPLGACKASEGPQVSERSSQQRSSVVGPLPTISPYVTCFFIPTSPSTLRKEGWAPRADTGVSRTRRTTRGPQSVWSSLTALRTSAVRTSLSQCMALLSPQSRHCYRYPLPLSGTVLSPASVDSRLSVSRLLRWY